MTGRSISFSEASNGWLATCSCTWEQWQPLRSDLERNARNHTCRKTKTKGAPS